MRKDKNVFERYEDGEDVPVTEVAVAVLFNGVWGIVLGILAMAGALVGLVLLAGTMGTFGAVLWFGLMGWWTYYLLTKRRRTVAETNSGNPPQEEVTSAAAPPVRQSAAQQATEGRLLRCIECEGQVPPGATSCPHCGYIRGSRARAKPQVSPVWWGILAGGCVLVLGAAVFMPASSERSAAETAIGTDTGTHPSVEEEFERYNPGFLANMSVEIFGDEKHVPCGTDAEIIERSNEILFAVFSNPQIDSAEVAAVEMGGEEVRLVETQYHWFPGDPGARSSAITWMFFSDDCRALDGGWEQTG